jgi:hypothetical protein
MQNARNENTITLPTVKYHVPAVLMTVQAGVNVVTESA